MSQHGVLLVNLGSPDSATTDDVRSFLREFLMDERVLDAPWPLRFLIVHGCILPFRPARSAEAYGKIWTVAGSPLITAGKQLQLELGRRLKLPVELAMRYRNPSIPQAVQSLRQQGVKNLLLIPLFPHYAMSSYETAVERVQDVLSQRAPEIGVEVVRPFYNHPDYVKALVGSAADFLKEGYDHLLFSFHGIPERHLHKTDVTGCHCLKSKDCCLVPSPVHSRCYRAQCYATMHAFLRESKIAPERTSIAFQSRLGREPWLSPYTDRELERLARAGVKRMLVICPAFVADCLETIEEIGLRGRDTFLRAGGQELKLIPCLNTHPLWVCALQNMVESWLGAIKDGA